MRPKRILTLMHPDLLPPTGATQKSSKDARWKAEYDVTNALRKKGHEVISMGLSEDISKIGIAIREAQPHIAFNLLEEFQGEAIFDQNVVSYLQLKGLPYTGNGPRGLILGRDKALSKKILAFHKVPIPKFQVFAKHRKIVPRKNLRFPLIVKSLVEESSMGISQASVVTTPQKLHDRIAYIFEAIETDAIVEEYIEGRELYVGVLGNTRLTVLPPWELRFPSDSNLANVATSKVKHNTAYRKKHRITTKMAHGLSDQVHTQISKLCKRICKALYLSGYTRLDFRLSQDGTPYFLEANPNPDISHEEDFAESAKKLGIAYPELIDSIVGLGLRRPVLGNLR